MSDYEKGRNGVLIRKFPYITYSGTISWNVRDILFKPLAQALPPAASGDNDVTVSVGYSDHGQAMAERVGSSR